MKTLSIILEKFFPKLKGVPVDTTPGLKIGKVVFPPTNSSFNEVFSHAHETCVKMEQDK